MLTEQEKDRFSRQINIKDIQESGQENIINSSVIVVGCGGLGSTVIRNLVGAGVGTLHIFDHDVVELSNLPRQFTFNETDLNKSKSLMTKEKLSLVDNNIKIHAYEEKFTGDNIKNLHEIDLIIDCSDNFQTKYFLNSFTSKNNIPLIYGSIAKYTATASLIYHKITGCINCLHPFDKVKNAPSAGDLGTWTPAVSMTASMQASLALEVLAHKDNITKVKNLGKVWSIDLSNGDTSKIKLPKVCKLH